MSPVYFSAQIKAAKRGSMILVEGFQGIDRATAAQRRRLRAVCLGHAFRMKRLGKHNSAAAWFDNAARTQ